MFVSCCCLPCDSDSKSVWTVFDVSSSCDPLMINNNSWRRRTYSIPAICFFLSDKVGTLIYKVVALVPVPEILYGPTAVIYNTTPVSEKSFLSVALSSIRSNSDIRFFCCCRLNSVNHGFLPLFLLVGRPFFPFHCFGLDAGGFGLSSFSKSLLFLEVKSQKISTWYVLVS